MYQLLFDEKCLKQIEKLDKYVKKILWNWIEKNLQNVENPRLKGKALKGNVKEYWRYRVGDYRLLVRIFDDKMILVAVELAHRKEVYE